MPPIELEPSQHCGHGHCITATLAADATLPRATSRARSYAVFLALPGLIVCTLLTGWTYMAIYG